MTLLNLEIYSVKIFFTFIESDENWEKLKGYNFSILASREIGFFTAIVNQPLKSHQVIMIIDPLAPAVIHT